MSIHIVDGNEISDAEWLRLLRNDLERQEVVAELDPAVGALTDTEVAKGLEEFGEGGGGTGVRVAA